MQLKQIKSVSRIELVWKIEIRTIKKEITNSVVSVPVVSLTKPSAKELKAMKIKRQITGKISTSSKGTRIKVTIKYVKIAVE